MNPSPLSVSIRDQLREAFPELADHRFVMEPHRSPTPLDDVLPRKSSIAAGTLAAASARSKLIESIRRFIAIADDHDLDVSEIRERALEASDLPAVREILDDVLGPEYEGA
jgi:hypothetical protein